MRSIISAVLVLALVFSALALVGCNGTGNQTPGTSAPSSSKHSPATSAPDTDETEPDSLFVINTTSRKFHLPDCTYALKISETNRDTSSLSAAELLDDGYVACGHCLGDLPEDAPDSSEIPESSSEDSAELSETNLPQPDTSVPEGTEPVGELHVLNTGTKKIHKPDCRYANNKNREDYTGDIQSLLDEGYTLCKTCHKD